jgi:hypothetical protein
MGVQLGGLLTACSGQARQGTAALVEAAGAGSRLDPPTAPPQQAPPRPHKAPGSQWHSTRDGPGGFVCQDQNAEPLIRKGACRGKCGWALPAWRDSLSPAQMTSVFSQCSTPSSLGFRQFGRFEAPNWEHTRIPHYTFSPSGI